MYLEEICAFGDGFAGERFFRAYNRGLRGIEFSRIQPNGSGGLFEGDLDPDGAAEIRLIRIETEFGPVAGGSDCIWQSELRCFLGRKRDSEEVKGSEYREPKKGGSHARRHQLYRGTGER